MGESESRRLNQNNKNSIMTSGALSATVLTQANLIKLSESFLNPDTRKTHRTGGRDGKSGSAQGMREAKEVENPPYTCKKSSQN